jgi:hypothetical protein
MDLGGKEGKEGYKRKKNSVAEEKDKRGIREGMKQERMKEVQNLII